MEAFTDAFIVAVVVFSAVVHEVMHGVMADWLGDPTARYAGRLTLNPLKHLDPFGSVILPAILALTHSPVLFGWAVPVPYNPYNLRSDGLFARFGEALVAAAGPLSNLALALLFGIVIRFDVMPGANDLLFVVVVVNTMLFLFNLIPVPPLDGSKILSAILPRSLSSGYAQLRAQLEHNPFAGMGLVLIIILMLGGAFGGLVYALASMIAGV
jgi:Zn-dependent protease